METTNQVTIDSILSTLRKWVEEKHPISPALWLDAAIKLQVLREDLDDKIVTLESDIADEFATLVQEMTVAKAKALAWSGERARELRKVKAKRDRIIEFVRICKKRVELPEYV